MLIQKKAEKHKAEEQRTDETNKKQIEKWRI